MGKFVTGVAIVCSAVLFLQFLYDVYLVILQQSWWALFNPFLYVTALIYWIVTPLVWLFSCILLGCIAIIAIKGGEDAK